uniref:POTRA domain-containing protein n=2 Tax=Flavobacterium sp. TaxID=239 RepID=UPI00404B89FA
MKYLHLFFLLISSYIYCQEIRIDSISFQGTKRMNTDFLRKLILSKSGSILDSLQLEKDVTLMNRLNGVSQASYKIVSNTSKNVHVIYEIKENFSLIPNIQVWTTDDVAAYKIGLYEYNFLGRNMTIGGYYQYNAFNSFGFNFNAPQLFNPNYGLELNVQKWASKEPVNIGGEKANYKYANTSYEVLGVHQFNFKNRIKLGLNLFREQYEYIDGATNPNVPTTLDVQKQLVKFLYSYDDVTFNYYLWDGFRNNLYVQYVTSDNDFQNKFLIGWNDFLYYKTINPNGNWASRLRLGLSSNDESPFSPFSVDNNLNIRGVGNLIDRGTGTIVLNTEYRHTLYEKNWFVLQGNAFVDMGTWRNPGGDFDDFVNSENVRVYPGLGVRFIHKTIFNAIFRLDYGYGISKNGSRGLVFGIGQYF